MPTKVENRFRELCLKLIGRDGDTRFFEHDAEGGVPYFGSTFEMLYINGVLSVVDRGHMPGIWGALDVQHTIYDDTTHPKAFRDLEPYVEELERLLLLERLADI